MCKRKGLFKDYEDALEAESKANEQAKSLQRAIANGKKKGANEPSQSSQDERQPLKMPFWKRRRLKRPRPRPLKVSSRFMQTFSAKSPDSAGTKLSPVKYLQGNEHTKERRESMESFQDCITFHLLYMFPGNAAKQQRFYISNVLKKPQRVPVRYFFQRVEQLNGYLLYLPCTYDSPRATAATKPVVAFDEAELANLLLHSAPSLGRISTILSRSCSPKALGSYWAFLRSLKK